VTAFANVARAFETPTTTELANRPTGAGGFNPDLQPQRATSIEAGARGATGDAVSWEVAAYRTAIRDALIPFEVPEVVGRQFFRNAGRAVHRGVEVGGTLTARRGSSLRVAYSWTDARLANAGDGAPAPGNRVPGVVPHLLDATLSAPIGGVTVSLEARAASRMPVDDANLHHSPGYLLLDAGLRAPASGGGALRWVPFLSVRNVGNAEYNASVVVNAFGARFFEPGPGRRLYLGAEVEYAPARGGSR
jgi:iron complex outermembrane recepter protein